MNVSLSPDGRVAAVQRTVQNNSDIWLIDSARTTRLRPIRSRSRSPCGRRTAREWPSRRTRPADRTLPKGFERRRHGRIARSPLHRSVSGDWSPDGRFLLYVEVSATTGSDLWALPMDGDREPFPFLTTSFATTSGQFSPDGRWVAYQSNESGRFEVYVRPFPGPGWQ